ncbi:MAG: hypothetical protein WDZ30_06205 [Cellvibrionaceae bacterium]
MKLEKVEPIVARFLGLDPLDMARHFYPATGDHLQQIVDIRQEIISRSADDDSAYLKWRYNFSSNQSDDVLTTNRVWIFIKDEVILGFLGVEAAELVINNTTVKALKVMDLVVKPELDGKGLGVWMNLRLQQMGRPVIALGSNSNSLGIVSKIFQRMPNQKVYKSILNSFHYFRSKTDNKVIAHCVAPIYDASIFLLLSARLSAQLIFSVKTQVGIRKLARFDVADDPILLQMNNGHIRFKRDHKSLNWRLFQNPRDVVEVQGLHENGNLVGYVALAFRSRNMNNQITRQVFILDWGLLPDGKYSAFLKTALMKIQSSLKKQGIESISAFSYDDRSNRIFRQSGLRHRDDDTKTVSIFSNNPATLEKLKCADQWFLTGADTDYA